MKKNKSPLKTGVRLTPGPTETPLWLQDASWNHSLHHRTKTYKMVLQKVREGLKELFGAPNAEVAIFPSSGTGVMEATVLNFMRRQEKVLLINTGYFADRWRDILKKYGASFEECKSPWGLTYDPGEVQIKLQNQKFGMVLIQVTDTATGVKNNCGWVGEMLRKNSPKGLLAVDAVFEGGVSPIKMNRENIDILVGATQKAFMLEPGVGYMILNTRALEILENTPLENPTYFFDLREELPVLRGGGVRFTPPVNITAGFHALLPKILKDEKAWYEAHRRRAESAERILKFLGFRQFASSPSSGLSVYSAPNGLTAPQIVDAMEQNGYIISAGMEHARESVIRFAHFSGIEERNFNKFLDILSYYIDKTLK